MICKDELFTWEEFEYTFDCKELKGEKIAVEIICFVNNIENKLLKYLLYKSVVFSDPLK